MASFASASVNFVSTLLSSCQYPRGALPNFSTCHGTSGYTAFRSSASDEYLDTSPLALFSRSLRFTLYQSDGCVIASGEDERACELRKHWYLLYACLLRVFFEELFLILN